MIALSITPDYFTEIGLLANEDKPSADADLSLLMRGALDKIAFLPFGLMVDQWRWKVFNGEYSPDEYNKGWWELREKYQGLRPPVERSESDDMSGYEGPLHSCSIYGNKEVGRRFNAMMELGSSKPWPDALEAFTGSRDMDGGAIIEYYTPLINYLKLQNKDRSCGW